jgi:hypothetical protein
MNAPPEPRRHLLIAGPGRSGTTVLVRLLSAMGLETHIERSAGTVDYYEDANAGLEDLLTDENAPYVVKSPWAYQWLDHALESGNIVVDHAIVPVRNLRDAAASRVITELQRINSAPGLDELISSSGRVLEHFASTAGGVTYSLEPLDQERILAMGFARLVEVLVRRDVPTILLDFPRFTSDAAYLLRQLRPVLGPDVTLENVSSALRDVVDPAKVRVGSELASRSGLERATDRPSLEELDAVAMRRLLGLRTSECEHLRAQLDRLVTSSGRGAETDATHNPDQP